jgi:glutamate-1-semialdehyde 2,1-aminomutase
LVIDEITMGWRLHFGGAHLKFGIEPDIAVFAKALGNGHPMAAVIGTTAAMAGAHHSFISSTYWTEAIGPAAALATIEKMRSIDVPAHVAKVGSRVLKRWRESGSRFGLPVVVGDGFPCLAHFHFEHELSGELGTLYTQLMLERGFLAGGSIYPTLAHSDEVVALYEKAIDEVFQQIAEALQAGRVRELLKGPVAHKGFKRLT